MMTSRQETHLGISTEILPSRDAERNCCCPLPDLINHDGTVAHDASSSSMEHCKNPVWFGSL